MLSRSSVSLHKATRPESISSLDPVSTAQIRRQTKSINIFQRLCAFFFNTNQVFHSQRPLTKEKQENRQDYTGMSDLYLFLLIKEIVSQLGLMHHENECLFQLTIENQVCMLLSVDIGNVGINP